MSVSAGVLVVGASAAGLSTAEALRRKGYRGNIALLGAEPQVPYDRPPLSKQILAGIWEPERARLRSAEHLAELGVDLVLGDPAVALDVSARTVYTESGRTLRGQAVVLATGVRARTLPGPALSGVHVLRTLDDATGLRAALLAAERVVVVGEGVLGAEISATARALGLHVTMVGPQPAPMAAQLGRPVADPLAELHTERGVALRLCAGVAEIAGARGHVTGVRLDTGEIVPADVVVVAIGGIPATDWLIGSGLHLDNGIVCDSHCRAAPNVYAAGDVARWRHERLSTSIRLENRTNATEQAAAVADEILGAGKPYAPVPYFWSDQFDARIQVHGSIPSGAEAHIVDGSIADRRFVARYRHAGRITGVVGWNMPKQVRMRRQELLGDQLACAATE